MVSECLGTFDYMYWYYGNENENSDILIMCHKTPKYKYFFILLTPCTNNM